ncbi:MAG: TetR family transcriptional regulator [Reyranella sp.]|nr:TetR family transcriptional regulator [Reyranella sp.]MDP3161846.1 TetR family transcriptional regulator [Reyranella sp.]
MNLSTDETAPPPPRRTQATRRRESDRRMLRAAARLFAERGVSGTSLADVGLAAGYSRGLPVERFGNKLGLITALLDSMDSWFQAHIVRILKDIRGMRAVRLRMEAHLASVKRDATATAALYSIYTESLFVMSELQPHVAAVIGRWREGLADSLREARRAGEIGKRVDCEGEARFLLGAMRGLVIQYLLDRSDSDFARSKTILLSHLGRLR